MNNLYKVEWEMFDPLFDDGMTIGGDVHSEVVVYSWERACQLFSQKIKNDFCRACFVTRIEDIGNEPNDPILSYCP